MSVFDPATFAQMTFTEGNSTESTPIPVGEWPFTISKSEISSWQSKADPTKAGLKCTLILETDDPAISGVTGRPKNTVRYEMMLDLTAEGGLDFGKGMNVNLGRAREAVGLNKPGVPFAFDMFVGRPVKGQIKHEEYQGRLIPKCTAVAAA
jgi:hypothetical protein